MTSSSVDLPPDRRHAPWLEAVVEASAEAFPDGTPIVGGLPSPYVRAWRGATPSEVEEIVRAMVESSLEADGPPWRRGVPPPATRLLALPSEAGDGLGGGVAARDLAGGLVLPGSCGTLDVWHDWVPFCSPRWDVSPWMGHDPSPMLERMESMIRVWSDCDDGGVPVAGATVIDFPAERFAEEMSLVWEDLRGFEAPLAEWGERRAAGLGEKLVSLWRAAIRAER